MTLTRLTLQSFGCHKDLHLDLTKRKVLILGDHASGKSTILDAITWLFTGRCRGLDQGGRGVKEQLLTKGVDGPVSVSANLVLDNATYQVTRHFASGATGFAVKKFNGDGAGDWTGGTEDQEAAWFSLLGVSREALLAMLDAETFLRREHADAKSLLLDFLQASITVPTTGEMITLQECERRYDEAFERRKVVNRDLKRTTAPVKPEKEVGDLALVQEKLAAFEQEQHALLKRQGELEGLGSAAVAQRDALEAELKTLQTAMPDLDRVSASAVKEADAAVKQAQAALQANNARVTGGTNPELAKIKAHEPEKGCVLNPAISCKTSLTEFVQFVRKHTPDGEPAKPSETAKLLADLDTAKATLAGRKDDVALAQRLEAKILDVQDRISALEDKLAAGGDGNVDDERMATEKTLFELAAKLLKARTLLAEKQARQVAWDAYGKAHTAYQALVQQSDAAEADVQLYGPKGLRVEALKAAVTGWTDAVNQVLQPFGYALTLSVDPWGLIVNGTPMPRLSTSERLRVALALQVAMAVNCNFKFTMIDSIDWLLKATRTTLTMVLNTSALEQVILAKAQDADAPVSTNASTQVIQL